jgi:hypothetical protein
LPGTDVQVLSTTKHTKHISEKAWLLLVQPLHRHTEKHRTLFRYVGSALCIKFHFRVQAVQELLDNAHLGKLPN